MSDKVPSENLRLLAEKLLNEQSQEATPDHVIRTQVMDSRIPKNEREWWAKRTIEELEQQLAELKAENARLRFEQYVLL